MGETGFCKNLRFSAVSCENLRFPAVFCANPRLPNPLIYRARRKSAKICKNLRKCAFRFWFLPFAVSLLARPFVHKFLFTIFVPLNPPPPNQQSDGFPLDFLLKDPKQNCEHSAKIANKPSKNCEQTELWTKGRFWFTEPSKHPSKNHVLLHDPLGVCTQHEIFWISCVRRKPQGGTGGRGRDRKCHKLSQLVVTFYDESYDTLWRLLWRFMSMEQRDGNCRLLRCAKAPGHALRLLT